MTKHSPHKRYKGHCPMCGKRKGNYGDSWAIPWPVLRKLGVARKYRRNRPYGDDEA